MGKKVSLGCVRLTVKDAKWIYNNCPIGTQVEFYSSSNPGPLGKPTAMKISDAPSNIRGWDPTDPDKNNPWPEYLEGLKNQENDDKNNNDKPSTGNNDKTNEVDTNTTVNEVTNTTTNETSGNTTTNTTTNETTNEAEENTTTNETTNKPEEGKDNTSSAQTSTNELESMAVNNV